MAIGDELSSIDFSAMIGGPLSAVVQAQADSAVTSVDFIKAVGFNTDDEGNVTEPVMVTFAYDKPVDTTAPDGTVTTDVKKFNLTVPFLTITQDTLEDNLATTQPGGVANVEYSLEDAMAVVSGG